MEDFGNGFGDWNVDWNKWRKGSALTAGTQDGATQADTVRLQPTAH
jgi:hypothetical protein